MATLWGGYLYESGMTTARPFCSETRVDVQPAPERKPWPLPVPWPTWWPNLHRPRPPQSAWQIQYRVNRAARRANPQR